MWSWCDSLDPGSVRRNIIQCRSLVVSTDLTDRPPLIWSRDQAHGCEAMEWKVIFLWKQLRRLAVIVSMWTAGWHRKCGLLLWQGGQETVFLLGDHIKGGGVKVRVHGEPGPRIQCNNGQVIVLEACVWPKRSSDPSNVSLKSPHQDSHIKVSCRRPYYQYLTSLHVK